MTSWSIKLRCHDSAFESYFSTDHSCKNVLKVFNKIHVFYVFLFFSVFTFWVNIYMLNANWLSVVAVLIIKILYTL